MRKHSETLAQVLELALNQRCSLRARLRDSPVLGQIREALMYGEQYYGSNSKNLYLLV